MASISAFKAQMQGGGARPNQFRVELNFPAIATGGTQAGNAAQFLCKTAQLPAFTLEDTPVFYRGREVHFAGERTFEPWTVTILNDTDFLIRNALESWSNSVVNLAATNGVVRPTDYQVDLNVHQLDRNDNIVKSYTFRDAYPTEVTSIELDFETNNAVETFDATFVYNFFTTEGI